MCVYLRGKFEVPRIILTSFRQVGGNFAPPKPHNETQKSTPRLALNSLKSKVDELDIDKLTPVPVDLNTLNAVVKNDIVKNEVCNGKI